MKIGSGIAIAGIWLGMGICALGGVRGEIVGVAAMAMFASLFVALSSERE